MLKMFSAEVFRAGVLVDVFSMKVASIRFGDVDRLEVSSDVFCSGFARIAAAAQSEKMLQVWEANMLHKGCGTEDWKKNSLQSWSCLSPNKKR